MRQANNDILGRQLPTRFFATAKKRVCFGNLDLGKLPSLPKGTCIRQGGLGNTLAPRQCEWGHIHEGNALLDVVAWQHRAKGTLRLGIHAHHGHPCEYGVIRIDIIVVHVDQDVSSCRGCGDVALLTDRTVAIQRNVLGLRKLTHQILDLVVSIIHNNPLQLVGRISLAQERLLGQSKELTTITGDGQNTDLRKFLLGRQKRFDRLVCLQRQAHVLKSLDPLLMACLLFLANGLSLLCALAIGQFGLLPKLCDQTVHRGIRKNSQTIGMRNRFGNLRKQGIPGEFAKRRNV